MKFVTNVNNSNGFEERLINSQLSSSAEFPPNSNTLAHSSKLIRKSYDPSMSNQAQLQLAPRQADNNLRLPRFVPTEGIDEEGDHLTYSYHSFNLTMKEEFDKIKL